MMKHAGVFVVAAAVLMAGMVVQRGQADEKQRVFMRAKLAYSQQALEGLALADYDLLVKSANQLKLLSLDVNWQVLQTEEFIRQSREFRRTTDALSEAGGKKNLDGAVLAYFQLTQSCVACHKHVRDEAAP